MTDTGARRVFDRRRLWIGVWAAVVFTLVFAYRFNTLGGALAGFDNDHFLFLLYAKQVQAGEQPLRDFTDGGLQGARPSLTYEVSAWAQQALGNNIRSEAVVTVGGVAAGAALTWMAASLVAAWPAAMTAAVLSALISPKLYGYPKVFVLAGISLLIAVYPRRPRWSMIAAMAAFTVVAFLFRHDYAVYCGAGCGAVILATHGKSVTGPVRAGAFGALAFAMLLPSLWWVERYAGLVRYLRNGLSMGAREVERTDLGWPVLQREGPGLSNLLTVENGEAWLYYLCLAMPIAVLLIVAVHLFRGERVRTNADPRIPALAGIAVMTLVLVRFFLRGSLEARFGDMAPPVAVLGAMLLAWGLGQRPRSPRRAVAGGIVALAFVVTVMSVWAIGRVGPEMERAGLTVSPAAVVRQALRISGELASQPAAVWTDAPASPSMAVARALHRCTRPEERVLVATYAPEILAFADRRFAGGRATVFPGFYIAEDDTRLMVARMQSERVPFVLAEADSYYDEFPGLRAYLGAHYVDVGEVAIDGGRQLRVLEHVALGHAAGAGAWLGCEE